MHSSHRCTHRPCLTGAFAFAGTPGTTAQARKAAGRFLACARRRCTGAWPVRTTDVLIVVSELVANAVRHAPGPCTLRLRIDREALEIAVDDGGAEPPTPRTPDRAGGRGLHLVSALTRGRVTSLSRGTGKTVTVVMLAGVVLPCLPGARRGPRRR